jgi:hemoglobin
MKRDIETKEDIEHIMRVFYSKMLQDDVVGYIFTDVAKINLETHLPHITNFWNNALFHVGGYKNNVIQIHKDLHAKEPLTEQHFERWLHLLSTTIDELHQGELCEKMKVVAKQIAIMIKIKMT